MCELNVNLIGNLRGMVNELVKYRYNNIVLVYLLFLLKN